MNEIERAIQEFEDNAYHETLKPEISNNSKTIALKALLEMNERNKACVGCKYENLGHSLKTPPKPCINCERRFEDYYEPNDIK